MTLGEMQFRVFFSLLQVIRKGIILTWKSVLKSIFVKDIDVLHNRLVWMGYTPL